MEKPEAQNIIQLKAGTVREYINEPWSPAEATDFIREMAAHIEMSLAFKRHAKEQMDARSIVMGDILYVLKNGFVYDDPLMAKLSGYFRYATECVSPNSGSRKIRLIVIPDYKNCTIKLITVMWVDEQETRAGTITEEDK